MRTSRFTPEQIIGFLKQVEAGMAVAELCRRHGINVEVTGLNRASATMIEKYAKHDKPGAEASASLSH